MNTQQKIRLSLFLIALAFCAINLRLTNIVDSLPNGAWTDAQIQLSWNGSSFDASIIYSPSVQSILNSQVIALTLAAACLFSFLIISTVYSKMRLGFKMPALIIEIDIIWLIAFQEYWMFFTFIFATNFILTLLWTTWSDTDPKPQESLAEESWHIRKEEVII